MGDELMVLTTGKFMVGLMVQLMVQSNVVTVEVLMMKVVATTNG